MIVDLGRRNCLIASTTALLRTRADPASRADPADSRRGQAPIRPAQPHLADHPSLSALVLVAARPPGPSPMVSPACPPSAADQRGHDTAG